MTIFWQMAASFVAGILVGWLGVALERREDARMMRRLEAQAWYAPMGTREPANLDAGPYVG